MSTIMIATCEVCKHWDKDTWLCSNRKIGAAPHNDQGMREPDDDCIKPLDNRARPSVIDLFPGPDFGCIHYEQ